ncbi:flagellar biosynthetic protein FliQ [Sphingomonas sp. Leaf20]|uniref:flagellar biosynthetic protein FliQ n=1 Tax=Sphingomonas sp. Leaf20 TaxID=1735685 RepID=UPI0006FBB439|nr:flagellar biosynthetic protein FliQ [Sphingomonas sp. Leaf20]KQM71544.1 flagellar biosynthetic protein FliQ [Sphingomonas sp. Leaf20]
MTPAAAIDIARAGMMLLLTICGPLLLVSMIVGVAVSLFQALTQIQEQTLTFVPKLVAAGIALLVTLPMIGHALANFTAVVADRIVAG